MDDIEHKEQNAAFVPESPETAKNNAPSGKIIRPRIMKDKKTLLFVLLALIFSAIVLAYLGSPARKKTIRTTHIKPQEAAETTRQLEQLKDSFQAIVQINRKIDGSLQEEKKERVRLEQALNDANAQQQSLVAQQQSLVEQKQSLLDQQRVLAQQQQSLLKELAQAKAEVTATQPLRQKITAIESSLDQSSATGPKKNELKHILKDIHKKLDALDSQAPLSLKENASSKQRAENLQAMLSQKETRIQELENQAAAKAQKNQPSKTDALNIPEELKKMRQDREGLDKKITGLENVRAELAQANAALARENTRLEKTVNEAQRRLAAFEKEKETLTTHYNASLKNLQESSQRHLANTDEEKQVLVKSLADARNSLTNTQKLQNEAAALQKQLTQLTDAYAQLQNAYTTVKETLSNNEIELGKRANRILSAEEKQVDAHYRLSEVQARAKELERESALLREQNVAVQIEKETAKTQLARVTQRLSELEGQASLITTILQNTKPPEPPLSHETKKIKLEITPVKDTEPSEPPRQETPNQETMLLEQNNATEK